jgi:hypothetical protein
MSRDNAGQETLTRDAAVSPGGPPRVSGAFDAREFERLYRRYAEVQLTYAELERRAGGLPKHRSVLRQLWDAFEAGISLGHLRTPRQK